MSALRCPEGHASADADWCSVCGAPMAVAAASAGPLPLPATVGIRLCPECNVGNAGDALFCEDCGYDFTTGQKVEPLAPPSSFDLDGPAPAPAGPAWVAELWVDPAWYDANKETAGEPCPAAGLPAVHPVHGTTLLIGRRSASKQVFPDLDCSADAGVSRRHAQLTLEGDRWYVEDLGSTNGTFVAAGDGTVPTDPIEPQRRRELGPTERVYVGAWTRIVLRAATPAERGS